ncbi:MAG: carbohydrate ABC transporter permease [Anaerolineae bacterium]|nr:carbohydrate ABC transporter permease [Anaerolineae bacterium]
MSATVRQPAAAPTLHAQRFALRRSRVRKLFLFIAALIIALILGLPLLYMTASSFKPAPEVFIVPPAFFPTNWTLEGYNELIELSDVPVAFRNGLIVSGIAAILGVTLSIGLCYTITRFRLPGLRLFTYLILLVYILPSILLIIPIYSLWARLGLTGGLLPLAITHVSFTLPFAVWMMRSYFAAIPLDLEAAALVDGATRLQAFLKVVMPLARPGIIATFIFTFILSWNEVLFASIFASSEGSMVISTALKTLLGEQGGWHSWGMVNAAGVVATVPVLIFFIFIQRQLVTGFTSGAVKG